ncbi:MAG: hypothetical protein ORN85_04635 [Sediminibacterium sp.]|nr:hypothetical protein [Sediminibacterium sp.]
MVSGSSDSLFSFIIPANLSNGVYKLRGINMNDSSKNSFVIRINNNFDSIGIISWGDNTYNQTEIPEGLDSVVQISGGNSHVLALTFGGKVVSWGYNSTDGREIVPIGLNNVVQVSAGQYHSLALKSDGTVIGWGDNGQGQISIPVGLINVVEISAGSEFSLALQSDGTVIGWGNTSTAPAGLDSVIQISAGVAHSIALKSDSIVVGWGFTNQNQTPIPSGLDSVVRISAGGYFSLGLKSDSTVVSWGDTTNNQISIPANLKNVVQISTGYDFSVAIKSDGSVVAWGDTTNTNNRIKVPVGLNNVVDLSTGSTANQIFALYRLNVQTRASQGGIITPTTFVKRGDSLRVIYTPNQGYYIDSLFINDSLINDSISGFTFRNITSYQTIRVVFSNKPKIISINKPILTLKDTLVIRGKGIRSLRLQKNSYQPVQIILSTESYTKSCVLEVG